MKPIDLSQMVNLSPLQIIQLGPFSNVPLAKLAAIFFIILISSLPLYLAVKLLRGKTSLLKVFLVNVIIAVAIPAVYGKFGFLGGVIAFILVLFIYKLFFGIGWIRSLLVWLLQGFFVFWVMWLLTVLRLFL